MKTIVEWVVEEVGKDGNVKKSKFSSYDEALDIYENLKTQNPEKLYINPEVRKEVTC
jgi:hypothetical protein